MSRSLLNLPVVLFIGSVFITSDKFVDTENASKFYFVVVVSLMAITFFTIKTKHLLTSGFYLNLNLIKGIYFVCFIQALIGLSQYLNLLPSNHPKFSITGSFENPAGFAGVLSIAFPFNLFLLASSKGYKQAMFIIGLTIITISIFLSGSRAGMLAVIVSSSVFFLLQRNIISKFKQDGFYKLFSVLALVLLIAGAVTFYHLKKDSANGRVLIWKVSTIMIQDKPIFGHGYGAFKAKYMDYQAKYFLDNPNSQFKLLADNVKHPFNEFMKVAVEFGLSGLIALSFIILVVLWKIKKSKSEFKILVLSGLVSYLVFAFFSYPLQYVAVWLLIAFYFFTLLPSKEIKIKNTTFTITGRILIVIVCIFFIFNTFKQVSAEIKWKTIAVKSLNGKTDEMLPEYEKLYSSTLRKHPFFLYNYGAELNVAGRFDESIDVLAKCQKYFNDYDLQLLLADNYRKKDDHQKAIRVLEHASNMIPCRFIPLYQLFEIYIETRQIKKAKEIAKEIVGKQVKIPSSTVSLIKARTEEFLENKVNE